nr:hypothetical protein [candidate division Zixibacteria bacterium]
MEDSFFGKDENQGGQTEIPRFEEAQDVRDDSTSSLDRDRGLIAAILSYIPFLCLIPLLQMRDNEQARFHSRQGLILFLIELMAVLFLIPGLSSMFWKTIIIAALGASVAGIILGIQGRKYKLPLIGDLAEKINL